MTENMSDRFAVVQALLDALRDEPDLDAVRTTLTKAGGVLVEHWAAQRTSKKPLRGLGYTLDEALIVASISEHGSLPAAVRAHFPDHNAEWHEAWEKRIRRRTADIDAAGVPDYIGPGDN